MDTKFDEAMLRARVAFMRKPESVFLTTVCFMLRMVVGHEVKTGATDGKNLYINPDFFMKLDPDQRVTLLAHEAMHVALQHCLRWKHFTDKHRFNKAADYVINLFLLDAKFKPIEGWLCDEQYRNMTTEQVYDLLEDDDAMPLDEILPPGHDNDDGDQEQDNSESEAAAARAISEILATAAQAAVQAGQPGSVPSFVQVFLDKLLKPKLPMAQHLKRFFQAVAKTDYSWQKINRRFRPMLLPGLSGTKMGHMAFAYDMSGSVSDRDTLRYCSEMMGVMRHLKPEKITLVQFDTDIKAVDQIRSVAALAKVKLVGRGGTYIEPLMQWALKTKPTALIVFTDGEFQHPLTNPGVPVLWMIHGPRKERFRCDFGRIILFDV